MLNITSENSIDAMKKSNIINKNVRIDNEVWNEAARNTIESLNIDSQIFENDATDNNLSNSKISNIYARVKFNIRRSNRLIEIENSLNSVGWSINTTTFATINKVSIEKKWNAVKIEEFETYINDYNFEDFLIASLISRNRSFAVSIFSKQSTLSMNYAKKKERWRCRNNRNHEFQYICCRFRSVNLINLWHIFFINVFLLLYESHKIVIRIELSKKIIVLI